jgi:hypothetical protein
MFRFIVLVALALSCRTSLAADSLVEDFFTHPFARWSYGIGTNDHNQFTWTGSSLNVHLDSSLPTVRLQRPLGTTLTDTNDFLLKARFSFTVTSAPTNQSMQIAFGLVNSALTGGNRTGTDGIYIDDDVFHTIEFNYFPNISTFSSPPIGPTLTPAVFGAQKPRADAFGNFAAYFFSEADLADNTTGINELPQSVTLEAVLLYRSATKMLTLTMNQVNPDGSLTLLDTEVPPMSLISLPLFGTYDANFPFTVDSLAIMAYHDGFTTTNNPSLVADLTFQRLSFYAPPPEPPSNVAMSIVGTNVLLIFSTTSNFFYEVQSKADSVSGPWSTIASNITGTGGIMTNIDVGAATAPRRFYRVGITAP